MPSLGPKRRSEEQPGWTPRSTACSVVRRIDSMTASQVTHDAIVDLGFEGSVLKRGRSIYRGGRTRGWVKVKASYTAEAVLLRVHQDREGHWQALCDVDGRTAAAIAGPGAVDRVGEVVRLVYSRVDADGGLREARLEPSLER